MFPNGWEIYKKKIWNVEKPSGLECISIFSCKFWTKRFQFKTVSIMYSLSMCNWNNHIFSVNHSLYFPFLPLLFPWIIIKSLFQSRPLVFFMPWCITSLCPPAHSSQSQIQLPLSDLPYKNKPLEVLTAFLNIVRMGSHSNLSPTLYHWPKAISEWSPLWSNKIYYLCLCTQMRVLQGENDFWRLIVTGSGIWISIIWPVCCLMKSLPGFGTLKKVGNVEL